MPAERFYVPQDLFLDQVVLLEDQEFHHLVNVMRSKEGEAVEVVNGKGALGYATVQRIEKKRASLHIKDVLFESKNKIEIILAQAIPRLNRLDFILEKGTELGMSQLWLFPTQLSDRKELTDHQLERMKSITIAAMKQCGRLFLPQIVIKPALPKWEKPAYNCFFGDLNPQAPIFSKLQHTNLEKGILFYIGPESGFTAEETQLLQRMGVEGVKLHPNILRTDTAALVALSLASQLTM
jgi:16S rRNA (uracil1498-N3)-methyltransferase